MADPRENPEVLNALVHLMENLDDPSGLSDEVLIAAALEARETKKAAELAAAVELASRGWSWRKIGQVLFVDHSTAYGWVRDAGRMPDVLAAIAARKALNESGSAE